jgi:hypothetical protein
MGFMVMVREAAVYDYFVGTNAGVRNMLEGRDSKFSSDRGLWAAWNPVGRGLVHRVYV